MKSGWKAVVTAIAAASLAATPALAQTPSAAQLQQENLELKQELNTLEDRVNHLEGLDQRVRIIDRKVEVQQENTLATQQGAAAAAKKMPVVKIDQTGFYLQSPDQGKAYNLHVGGWIQSDGRFWLNGSNKTSAGSTTGGSTFLIRRARLLVEGTVGNYFDFRLMPDFGQGTTVLEDAYGDVHYFPWARLRFGKFKEPVGMERLVDDRYLWFVERSFASELVPDRDIGLEYWGQLFDNRLLYQFAFMNGTADNASSTDADNNDAKDFAGRIFINPFQNTELRWAKGVGLGLAGTFGDEHSTTLDTFKSTTQDTIFTYASTALAAGSRYRFTPQANYLWGPFGLQGEYVSESSVIRNNTTTPTGAPTVIKKKVVPVYAYTPRRMISNQAWQISAAYLLTGEDEGFSGITPNRNFDPRTGDPGAIEIVARGDQLLLDRDIFNYGLASAKTAVSEATEWEIGVNWYLSYNVKLQADYENTVFSGGGSYTSIVPQPGGKTKKATILSDRRTESAILTQLQISF